MSNCVCRRGAQVNIDSQTRQLTRESVHEEGARADAFEAAQRRIESLMEKDSYQRFLRSSHYLSLATSPTPPPASAPSESASKPSKPRSFGERRARGGEGDGGGSGGAGSAEGKFGLLYVPGSGSGSEEETPTVESNALVESESSLSETPSAAFAPDGLLPLVCEPDMCRGAMRRLYGSAASFDSQASLLNVRAALVDASEISRMNGAESPHSHSTKSIKSIATLAERNSSPSPVACISPTPQCPQSSIGIELELGIENGLGPPSEKGSTSVSALSSALARTGSDKTISVSDEREREAEASSNVHDTKRQRTPTPTRSGPADDVDGEPDDMQVVATFIAELAV